MVKIIEGRIRIGALCRLCFGDDSLESLKSSIDLASAYATQGMWEQVSEVRTFILMMLETWIAILLYLYIVS